MILKGSSGEITDQLIGRVGSSALSVAVLGVKIPGRLLMPPPGLVVNALGGAELVRQLAESSG